MDRYKYTDVRPFCLSPNISNACWKRGDNIALQPAFNKNSLKYDARAFTKGIQLYVDIREMLFLDSRAILHKIIRGDTMSINCAKCGGATAGWKCAICGSEYATHDSTHLHEGSDRYCMPRCQACGQADALCTCTIRS